MYEALGSSTSFRTDSSVFLVMVESYSIVCTLCIRTISVDGHLGCSPALAIVNSVAMNTGVHVSFSIIVSSGCMPSSGIAGSYGSFIPSF